MVRTVIQFTDSSGYGGAEEMLLTLLEGLDRQRWQPVLMHHDEPGIAILLERARRLGVRTRAVRRLEGRRGAAALPRLVREIRSEKAAVFHAHLCWTLRCSYGLVAAALARTPAVVATQQLFSDIRHPRAIIRQNVVAAAVDRYIAVSKDLARRLGATPLFPRRKIRVVPNAVRVATFESARAGVLRATLTGGVEQPVILTLARLDRQKDLPTLVRAAALVPGARFIVAGEGPERAMLEREVGRLGLVGRLLLLGHRDDVPELLASCDLFVLPSLYEGLPVSVLEAMAAGRPVVATAAGGTDEAVVHGLTGLLVPPGDAAALAGAIRQVLADPALSRRLASAGRERVVCEFSAEAMVRRVMDLYEEVLAA
jgi:glycosyltransferase involved in cell wall biosynthesis